MGRDYIAIANGYIEDVLSGRQLACEFVRLACQRQLNDLSREGTDDFPYWFNEEEAAKPCAFIELLPHIEGEWAKKKLKLVLEPWQVFLVVCLFGWLKEDGNRRFVKAYIEVAKKNGKSALASGLALYMLAADGEEGPQVYSGATTSQQAGITWRVSKAMVEKCPDLQRELGVYASAHSIYCTSNGGFYRALSRENGGNQDGVNTHFGLVDELHAHTSPDLVENLETSMAARAQAMLFQITTAGFNMVGVCFNTRSLCVKILNEVVDAEHYFAIIYTLDAEDDWTDPAVWPKSNPNWGVSIDPKKFAAEASEAVASSAKEGYFVTKRLNVWRNAKAAWMNMKAWGACADPDLRMEDFAGEDCYVGLDLANSTDIAAMMFVVVRGNHVYVFPRFYLPESEAETGEGAHYAGWALDGCLTLTPGNVTDQNLIQDDLRAAAGIVRIKTLAYDPWQAKKFAIEMQQEGMETMQYDNHVKTFSAPMKAIFAMVKDVLTEPEKKKSTNYQLTHDGNPAMGWMMSNVVAHLDGKDNIYPRKEQAKNKIDGPVALIMAIGAWGGFEEEASEYIYEGRGLNSL